MDQRSESTVSVSSDKLSLLPLPIMDTERSISSRNKRSSVETVDLSTLNFAPTSLDHLKTAVENKLRTPITSPLGLAYIGLWNMRRLSTCEVLLKEMKSTLESTRDLLIRPDSTEDCSPWTPITSWESYFPYASGGGDRRHLVSSRF